MKDKAAVIFPLVMALFMACMMSGILTFVYMGAAPHFFSLWLHGFLVAWPCASVVVFIAIPAARWCTRHLVELLEKFR